MHYDPKRYIVEGGDSKLLVGRWSTEASRNYRLPSPTEVVHGGTESRSSQEAPATKPPAPQQAQTKPLVTVAERAKVMQDSVAEVEKHVPVNGVLACGQVPTQRPPFHNYRATSPNVLPPRQVKEPPVEAPHAIVRSAESSRDGASCKYCRFLAQGSASGYDRARQHAEMIQVRRHLVEHRKPRGNRGSARQKRDSRPPGSVNENGPSTGVALESAIGSNLAATTTTLLAPPVVASGIARRATLQPTDLFLCSSCGRVTRKVCSLEQTEAFLALPCGGCGRVTTMPLLAVDTRSAAPIVSSATRPPTPASRPDTPLETTARLVRQQSPGVVPMCDRRTSLGERIKVGRGRVLQSPQRRNLTELSHAASEGNEPAIATGGLPVDLLQKWANEPLSANDSTNAKSCLTWFTE